MIDQATKAWAVRRLRFGDGLPVISGFLNFTYAQNTGIAFSMLDDSGDGGRWGLSIVAIVAGALVLYFFWRTPRSDDRILGALALLLAGIAGNVTDPSGAIRDVTMSYPLDLTRQMLEYSAVGTGAQTR